MRCDRHGAVYEFNMYIVRYLILIYHYNSYRVDILSVFDGQLDGQDLPEWACQKCVPLLVSNWYLNVFPS